MDRCRTIKYAAGEVDSLANYIQRKYYSKGFQTQKTPFEENGIPGLMLQIRNTSMSKSSPRVLRINIAQLFKPIPVFTLPTLSH